MHKYPRLHAVSVHKFMSGFHSVTVLVTDGPEWVEGNVTHEHFDLHDVWSSLQYTSKSPETVGFMQEVFARSISVIPREAKHVIFCTYEALEMIFSPLRPLLSWFHKTKIRNPSRQLIPNLLFSDKGNMLRFHCCSTFHENQLRLNTRSF